MTTSAFLKRISSPFADPDSHHRQIMSGFLLVSIFVLIGRSAGAAKEMAIAWRYGVNDTVDAYIFVFNIINWPVSVWFSVLTVMLVPLVANVRNKNPGELTRFSDELLGLTLLVGTFFGLFIFLVFPPMLRSGWTGLTGGALGKALDLSPPLSLLAFLGAFISLFSAWTLAYGRHRNTLFEAIPALVLLAALLLPPSWMPRPLLWGTLGGFVMQLVALAVPLYRQHEFHMPRFSFQSPAWRGFWSGMGIMAIGQTLMGFTGIIDQFFAAYLEPGAVATLSYANRIVALILSFGSLAVSRATLPVFSKAYVKNSANLKALTSRWGKGMLAVGLIILVIGWMLAPILVKTLFERGAFSPKNTAQVSHVMRFFLLQMPCYFSGIVLMQQIVTMGRYNILLVSATVATFLKILMNILLVKIYSVAGIALSTSIFITTWWAIQAIALMMESEDDAQD